ADKSPATKGETITLTATPADGYKLGSYTVKNGEESVIVTNGAFTMPAGNVTVSATFTAISYEITYNLDGGTNASANPATYTIGSDDIILSNASKDGYTFSGWQNADGETVTKIAKGTTGDITLTATWTTANGISVTIAPESTISVEQAQDEDTITLTASAGFTGYSWRIDGEPASSVTGAAVSEDGTTLTLTKASLTQGNVYQISLSATKGGIPYGTQISVKK
ncbi:MAG: InlB B-repeat-containing protein, partial [Treponema sp.]|nr:InlB B-repeat-containing protein [Treponema sp.]